MLSPRPTRQFPIFPVIAGLLLFQGAAHAASGETDRIIGLLALPQLFGDGSCASYEAHPLPIFEAADSTDPIGEVTVDAPWIMAAEGGCDGLKVGVHRNGEQDGQAFWTLEYGYEAQAGVVLARQGGRYKIKLDDSGGAAWVEPMAGARFHSLEKLITEGLTYLAVRDWSGRICNRPNEPAVCWTIKPGAEPYQAVTVFSHRRIGDELWFEIRLPPAEEGCEEPIPGVLWVRGWISAFEEASDEPVIWFSSRGC